MVYFYVPFSFSAVSQGHAAAWLPPSRYGFTATERMHTAQNRLCSGREVSKTRSAKLEKDKQHTTKAALLARNDGKKYLQYYSSIEQNRREREGVWTTVWTLITKESKYGIVVGFMDSR